MITWRAHSFRTAWSILKWNWWSSQWVVIETTGLTFFLYDEPWKKLSIFSVSLMLTVSHRRQVYLSFRENTWRKENLEEEYQLILECKTREATTTWQEEEQMVLLLFPRKVKQVPHVMSATSYLSNAVVKTTSKTRSVIEVQLVSNNKVWLYNVVCQRRSGHKKDGSSLPEESSKSGRLLRRMPLPFLSNLIDTWEFQRNALVLGKKGEKNSRTVCHKLKDVRFKGNELNVLKKMTEPTLHVSFRPFFRVWLLQEFCLRDDIHGYIHTLFGRRKSFLSKKCSKTSIVSMTQKTEKSLSLQISQRKGTVLCKVLYAR